MAEVAADRRWGVVLGRGGAPSAAGDEGSGLAGGGWRLRGVEVEDELSGP